MDKKYNRVKYNFYKTLYNNDLGININPMKDRIKRDFESKNLQYTEEDIDSMIWSVMKEKRYEIMEFLFD